MKVRFAVSPALAEAGGGIIAFAAAVEAAGFDGIWLSDLPAMPALDPLLGLAAVAGHTTRLHLGANVVPLGRPSFVLAKQLAQLDRLSGGRLLLSFVTGIGGAAERAALELGDAGRGEELERMLAEVRSRWQDPELAPEQDPLEVWVGGRGPRALERAGRVADGWLGAQVTPEEAATAREAIVAAATAAGREFDPEHFGLSIPYARAEPDPQTLSGLTRRRPELDPRTVLGIGPDGLAELVGAYIEAGLSKFVLRPAHPVTDWPQEAAWLADAILALQT